MKFIGPYQVLGLLGRGGMARVYKVRHDLGPVRALKLFAPREELAALLPEGELLQRFLAEANTLAELKHPNLVRVLAVHAEQPAYYVMEHHCLSLSEVIGEGPRLEDPTRLVGLDQALAWGAQALAGLGALHAVGVVHRDLKPANLMLGDDEAVRLGDLGLSHRRGERPLGQPNLVLGSPAYAAPEQEADPLAVDGRADLYALGVSLYRLLTGRLPESGDRASELRPELDAAWDDFFAQAMAPEPGQRYPDAPAMAAALERLAADWRARQEKACAAPPAQPPTPSEPPGPPPRSASARIRLAEAQKALGLDQLMRPQQWWPRDLADLGQGAVRDRATGLVWQAGGSPQPLAWHQTPGYIQALNLRRLAGRSSWRLPTAPELLTLLAPPPAPGEACGPPLLDPLQERLWSSDAATATTAWYANLSDGYVGRADRDCFLFVRAVSG